MIPSTPGRPDRGPTLLAIARTTLALQLGRAETEAAAQARLAAGPWLHEHAATFVTLTQRGELRGCIGTLVAHRPLVDDVAANALAAAFRDTRFAPLQPHELELTAIEVSVLTAPVPLGAASEEDACQRLRPGVHGVILSAGRARATFLPQVWDDLPEPRAFLAHLKRKAGLPAAGWPEGVALEVYEVTKHAERARGDDR